MDEPNDEPGRPARWTDPETSHESGNADKEVRRAQCQMVLELHRKHPGGLANFEVAEMLGLPETSCIWHRVTDLRKGIIKKDGTTIKAGGYLEWAPNPDGTLRKKFREQTRKSVGVHRITVKGLTEDWA